MVQRSAPARKLIWVPVIHTQADLGSMSETIRALHVRHVGQEEWARRNQTVEDMWRRIRQQIEGLDLAYEGVRLYQDGLPDCGHEADIVRDLAQAGSSNHQLLQDLMAKGAQLTGTEAPQLLLEEYELARQMLTALAAAPATDFGRRQQGLSQALLERRDDYIAKRIAQTLQPGETGLIFLGMLHSLKGRLPSDVHLSRLGEKQTVALSPAKRNHERQPTGGAPSDPNRLAPPAGSDHG